MINRRKLIPTIFAVALAALCLPAVAMAQGNYDPYGNYPSRDNRRYDNYNHRQLRDSVKRLENLSGGFQRHLDSALDRSRYEDSQREDRINDVAREFRNAADRLEDRYDDGKNINRSSAEARRVLQIGSQLDAFMRRHQLGGRAESDWARIRQELNVISNAYGFNMADFDNRDYRYNDDRDYRRRVSNRRINLPW